MAPPANRGYRPGVRGTFALGPVDLWCAGLGSLNFQAAALLVAHGWVHVMFVFPRPTPSGNGSEWPFDLTRLWLVSATGLDVKLVRITGIVLMSIVVVGLVLAALSIVGLLVPTEWWAGLLVVGAAASFLMLALFFSPQLVLGLAIDLALLGLVFGSGWSPTSTVGQWAGYGSA